MMGVLVPVGYGGKEAGGVALVVAHVFGSTLAAAAMGAALGTVGLLVQPSDRVTLGIVATVCCAYAFHEAGLLRLPAPQIERQVPHGWRLRYPPIVAAALYGAGLGVGVGTLIPVTTFYVVSLAALLAGTLHESVLVLATYGFLRAAPLGWARRRLSAPTDDYDIVVARLWALRPVVRLINGLALAAAGAGLAALAVFRF